MATRDRKNLRYSVVFAPEGSNRLSFEPNESSLLEEKEGEIKKEDEEESPSILGIFVTTLRFALLQGLTWLVLVPLFWLWKGLLAFLHLVGIKVEGATLLMLILNYCFFVPVAITMQLIAAIFNAVGFSLNGPKMRSFIGLGLNGFGFAWHAVHDTFSARNGQWRVALTRFHTFLQRNGLDLELQMCVNERFFRNISVYDDVQRVLGLDANSRAEDTRMDPDTNVASQLPSYQEAAHFMHFATGVYGTAVIVGTLLEIDDQEGLKRLNSLGTPDGLNDEKHVLTYLQCKEEDVVASNLASGGSMDVLRHLIVVDHKAKALVFAIRGTFSISGVISDWVSFCAPFCGGVGHVAMSEVATNMWKDNKAKVLAKLNSLPSDYSLVITGHSLGAGVACLLTILLYHEKCSQRHKIRCFAFAPPPTFFPLSAAPEAVAATTAYIHRDDTVPFLSVFHLRRFFRSMAALDNVTRKMTILDLMRIDWGYKGPTQEMVEAVRKAEEQKLRRVAGAERVGIPAKAVVWFQPPTQDEVAGGVPENVFIPKVCDPEKLAQLPIRVPKVQFQLLTDHVASKYEIAFKNVYRSAQNARLTNNG